MYYFPSLKVDGKRTIDLGAGWRTKRMDKNLTCGLLR